MAEPNKELQKRLELVALEYIEPQKAWITEDNSVGNVQSMVSGGWYSKVLDERIGREVPQEIKSRISAIAEKAATAPTEDQALSIMSEALFDESGLHNKTTDLPIVKNGLTNIMASLSKAPATSIDPPPRVDPTPKRPTASGLTVPASKVPKPFKSFDDVESYLTSKGIRLSEDLIKKAAAQAWRADVETFVEKDLGIINPTARKAHVDKILASIIKESNDGEQAFGNLRKLHLWNTDGRYSALGGAILGDLANPGSYLDETSFGRGIPGVNVKIFKFISTNVEKNGAATRDIMLQVTPAEPAKGAKPQKAGTPPAPDPTIPEPPTPTPLPPPVLPVPPPRVDPALVPPTETGLTAPPPQVGPTPKPPTGSELTVPVAGGGMSTTTKPKSLMDTLSDNIGMGILGIIGAIIGAVFGGPIGAFIGGLVGGGAGALTDGKKGLLGFGGDTEPPAPPAMQPKLAEAVSSYAQVRFTDFNTGVVRTEMVEKFVTRYASMVAKDMTPDQQNQRAAQIVAETANIKGKILEAAGAADMDKAIKSVMASLETSDRDLIMLTDMSGLVPVNAPFTATGVKKAAESNR